MSCGFGIWPGPPSNTGQLKLRITQGRICDIVCLLKAFVLDALKRGNSMVLPKAQPEYCTQYRLRLCLRHGLQFTSY
jgi:hypothetical protein